MQRCPRCGVRNLDSDIACFNCDEILTGTPARPAQPLPPDPDARPALLRADLEKAAAYEREDEERRARRVPAKQSFIGLVLGALLTKAFLLMLAFGLFSIVTLGVMWVAYDSTSGAAASLLVLALSSLFAFFYPDFSRAALNGRRGGFVALLSDLLILAIILVPALYVAERKVSGAAGYILDYWWVVAGLLAEAFLAGFLFGYRAWRRARERAAAAGRGAPAEAPLPPPDRV